MDHQDFFNKSLNESRGNDIRTLKRLRFLFKFFIFLFFIIMLYQLFSLIHGDFLLAKVKTQLLINAFLSGLTACILLYLKEEIIDEAIEILKNNFKDENKI